MSIINTKKNMDHDEKVKFEVERIRGMCTGMFSRLRSQHSRVFNSIWKNKNATPQEIFDEYGTDAGALFEFSNQIQTMAAALDPDYVPLISPHEYSINPDGTVTVGAEITPE